MQSAADLPPPFGSLGTDRIDLRQRIDAGLFLSFLFAVTAFVAVVLADPFKPELPAQATGASPSGISAPAR